MQLGCIACLRKPFAANLLIEGNHQGGGLNCLSDLMRRARVMRSVDRQHRHA